MPKLQKIKEILDARSIPLKDFAQAIGLSEKGVKQMIKRNSTRIQTLERIAEVLQCPIDFLFDDRATPIKSSESKRPKQIPHIPYSAQAGSLSGFSEAAVAENCLYYQHIDFIGSYDFTIDIYGDSMTPTFNNGDTLACKRLEGLSDLQAGKVYILDTVQGVVLKEIQLVPDHPDRVLCVSHNELFKPYELPLEEVFGISQVIAVVKKA